MLVCLPVFMSLKINFHLGIKKLAPGLIFRHTDPLLMVHILHARSFLEHHLLDYLIQASIESPAERNDGPENLSVGPMVHSPL